MAETVTKKEIEKAVTYWKGEEHEFVKVPALDYNGSEFPDCRINDYEFKAGKVYRLHPDMAIELDRIIETHKRVMMRMNSSLRNLEALRQLEPRGSALGLDVVRD